VNAVKIPDDISDDVASMLDPLGNAVHTALSFNLVGEDVLISGAGPIGIMAAAICRHVGARHISITDVNEYRLALAESFGISNAVNVRSYPDVDSLTDKLKSTMQLNNMTEGYDIGLEMSGNEMAINSMVSVMNTGGRIAALGLTGRNNVQLHWDDMVFKGLWLKGIYGREMFDSWYKMLSMLQSGLNVDAVITHRYPLSEYQQAFEVVASGECGKVILDWC
jgi:threonine 3-dehydrogenase